jgi:hypothetical protein
MEKREYSEKIKAIRDTIDLTVDLSDLDGLQGKVLMLTQVIGLSSEVKARALKNFNDAKLIAYAKHKAEKLSPNVLKIVIEGGTSEEGAMLELADRLNAGIVHAMDGLRTIISLKKTEMEKSL